jgi:tRNA-guanine family transglycosylase
MFNFEIKKQHKKARTGVLTTPHGEIKTPGFVPVGTRGALKGISFEDTQKIGADIFMVNTFHFYCKKEYETVAKMGGLHSFLNINYPLMTDSGGFQVFSLGAGWNQKVGKLPHKNTENSEALKIVPQKGKSKVKIGEDGVVFASPFDGSRVEITPESSINAQQKLGADIIFAFDECTSPLALYEYQKKSLKKTHRWAEQSFLALKNEKQRMMGIVQGGRFEDLRKESARFISSLPFFGFGIGGSFGESFGDSKINMYSILDLLADELPREKPRHLLGIGEPEDLIEGAIRGVDTFDCVIPTRFARHGTALTSLGRINIKSACYKEDESSLDENCNCEVCLNYKKSYLHHLAKKEEILGIMLLNHHNLYFVSDLMKKIREAIENESIESFREEFLKKLKK